VEYRIVEPGWKSVPLIIEDGTSISCLLGVNEDEIDNYVSVQSTGVEGHFIVNTKEEGSISEFNEIASLAVGRKVYGTAILACTG